MSSGNFEIGRSLSMKGFNEYVKPVLEGYKAKITDIFSYKDRDENKILISLIGDANIKSLEQVVKVSLNDVSQILHDEERNPKNGGKLLSAMSYQVKDNEGETYNVIGLYQDNETASKVFQILALEYSLKNLDNVLKNASYEIREFGGKFKNF